jgi:hypothetical protein
MDLMIATIMRRALQAFCGALTLLLALPVLAQAPEMTPAGAGLAFDLAGHRMVIPPPVWTTPGDEPVEQAQTLFSEIAPGVESLVLIPADQTAVTWTRTMGILVVNRVGYTAATQLASVIDPITDACAAGELYATTFGGGDRGAVLLMCGHYRPNAPGVPRRCGGGIILATVLESTLGAAKIYYEWCTPTFDVEDRPNWPVIADDHAAYAENLMAVTAFVPINPAAPAGN